MSLSVSTGRDTKQETIQGEIEAGVRLTEYMCCQRRKEAIGNGRIQVVKKENGGHRVRSEIR